MVIWYGTFTMIWEWNGKWNGSMDDGSMDDGSMDDGSMVRQNGMDKDQWI